MYRSTFVIYSACTSVCHFTVCYYMYMYSIELVQLVRFTSVEGRGRIGAVCVAYRTELYM